MDYTFIFKISKDSISINKTKRVIDEKGLNNTNVIDTKELRFSPEYIKENSDLVSTFLNVVILKNNITTCIINSENHLEDLVQLVNGWDKITKLIFKPDITISFDVFLKLLENNYLGGSGSRGSGQVSFKNITIVKRDVGYYTEDAEEDIIVENEDINGAINAL